MRKGKEMLIAAALMTAAATMAVGGAGLSVLFFSAEAIVLASACAVCAATAMYMLVMQILYIAGKEDVSRKERNEGRKVNG